jgi:hypothetical protein
MADDENIVGGWKLATTSFTLEREVGLTIEGDDGARQWLSWAETRDVAAWVQAEMENDAGV